jgi:branched-chain amino acid transport system substrate-binding protein
VSGGVAGGTNSAEAAPCPSYQECLAAKASGADINYDGESGPVAFDANGDITSATFTVFTYGADNNPTITGVETAGRAAG